MRVTCTKSFGNAVTPTYGRLDGTLVSVVPPNHHGCNGDSTHIHLQVKANAAIYDVAVNVDGLWTEVDHDPIGIAWTEGWNTTASLDYPSRLGLHSGVFKTTDANALAHELDQVNHISVFATGYGPTGVHLVHRNGNDHDGALVLNPLSSKPRYVAFRFDNKPSF